MLPSRTRVNQEAQALAAVASVYAHRAFYSLTQTPGFGATLAECFFTTEAHPREKLSLHPSACPLPCNLCLELLATPFQEPAISKCLPLPVSSNSKGLGFPQTFSSSVAGPMPSSCLSFLPPTLQLTVLDEALFLPSPLGPLLPLPLGPMIPSY